VVDSRFVGQPVFRLDGQSFEEQTLVFRRTLQPSAAGKLTFRGRHRRTVNLDARVEVSTDAGATWTPAFSEAGARETEWRASEVDLSPFAGQPLLLRFSLRYKLDDSSVSIGDGLGWYIDDIAFVEVRESGEPVVSDVIAGPGFDFTASEAGDYDLDAQPQYSEKFLLGEWGPKKRIAVTAAAPPAPTEPAPTEAAPTEPEPGDFVIDLR
jgi:hypothetical protein